MSTPAAPLRYHSALVALHWILAVFLTGALVAGNVVLGSMPNSDPAKLTSFAMHMGLGATILVLMIVRLVVRLRTAHPAPVRTGVALADRLAPVVHYAIYAVAIAMAASGMALSVASGLPDAVFGSGTLPETFAAFPQRAVHGLLSNLLIALIGLHIAAVIWHGVRGDGIMSRMWFGPR